MQPELIVVDQLSKLDARQIESAVITYQQAFARIPYLETFTSEESIGALQYILDQSGDLLLGQQESGDVISLAGGYTNDDNDYFIEELAVLPERQGEGIGRTTLRALLDLGSKRNPSAFEIRTTARNEKAINLYESEGFVLSEIREVVAQTRQGGKIALDERVYLRKQIKEQSMKAEEKLRRVAIAYPSGNTTAVVYDQLSKDSILPNEQIINAWTKKASNQPGVEQCCFVTLPKDKEAVARVEMFGGEFCGNATRSVIQLITEGKDYRGLIEVSGVNRPLNFDVANGIITLEMPLSHELATIVKEGTLVQLDGIAQLVVTDLEQKNRPAREVLDTLLRENKYGLVDQPAVGVSFYDPESAQAQFCVWVGGTVQTIFDETACGSGTCAIGVAAALVAGENKTLEVIQPSGEKIATTATIENSEVVSSYISGTVRILYDGELSYAN